MKTIVSFIAVLAAVVVLSAVSAGLWGGKPEKLPEDFSLKVDTEMTVEQFITSNNLAKPFAKDFLGLQSQEDLKKKVVEFGSVEQIKSEFKKRLALKAEQETKNWIKIPIKFLAWFIFLGVVLRMLVKGKVTSKNRKWLYLAGVVIFGVTLGADPSPMGTVKDAAYLYGKAGAVFPPRMVALSIFLLTVIIANKFICSWGCQFGTLQDFVFRLARNKKDSKADSLPQYKIPFVLSNTFRLMIFSLMFYTAMKYGVDLFEHIDPFKIFKPSAVGIISGAFIGAMLILSLFTYRPWCHLFCPFGFVSWFFEKISTFNIKVDYDKCVACNKCSDACPSFVMDAILKQDKATIPDCFSCGVCLEVCPTKAVEFKPGKRTDVPYGKFS